MMLEPVVSGYIDGVESIGDKIYFTFDYDFVCFIRRDNPCIDFIFNGSSVTCYFNWDSQYLFDVDEWVDQEIEVVFVSPNKFTFPFDQPFYGQGDI